MRVCQDWFPKTNGFYMDENLVMQLDILIKNMGYIHNNNFKSRDWDFTIIITGQGEVRVGKSKIAMDISCYWAYQMEKKFGIKTPFTVKDNFVFEGDKLIQQGNYLGQNHPMSVLLFDEAGADLEGTKTMNPSTQAVKDYLRECGQYNMLNVMVLPEYFDLPKGIALSRSIFLIDVYYLADDEGVFQRGYFNFFSKRQKKWLYLKGKKWLDYHCVKPDFNGRFYNFYQVDEKEYRDAKQEALVKRESKKRNRFQLLRDAAWFLLVYDGIPCKCGLNAKMTQEQLGKRMEGLTGIFVPHNTISDAMRHYLTEEELLGLKKKKSKLNIAAPPVLSSASE